MNGKIIHPIVLDVIITVISVVACVLVSKILIIVDQNGDGRPLLVCGESLEAINISLIVFGCASNLMHLDQLLQRNSASATLCTSIAHFVIIQIAR